MSGRFHPGELRAQALAGVQGSAGAIRDFMPEQHRSFFAALPFMLAATLDADGWPQAQVLAGAPGFVSTPDPVTLRIAGATGLVPGRPVGLLGLDFATRRRNRANGVVRSADAHAVLVDVHESFGNCPQHIRLRDGRAVAAEWHPARSFTGLDATARAMLGHADTLFVASSGGAHGVDISHRGGPAGFVRIDGDSLTIPDFNGNRYFNTLGNMLLDARAALLLIDYAHGDVLTLQGRTSVIWEEGGALPGAEGGRHWRFEVARGTLQRAALPLRWSPRGG